MDLFTTLAAAAGIPDVAEKLKTSHKVHIDGVINLDHWTGKAPSARTYFIRYNMYNEATLGALRFGPWKAHFKERDGFFDYYRDSGLIFNLQMDPLEQRDGQKSNDLAMKMAF